MSRRTGEVELGRASQLALVGCAERLTRQLFLVSDLRVKDGLAARRWQAGSRALGLWRGSAVHSGRCKEARVGCRLAAEADTGPVNWGISSAKGGTAGVALLAPPDGQLKRGAPGEGHGNIVRQPSSPAAHQPGRAPHQLRTVTSAAENSPDPGANLAAPLRDSAACSSSQQHAGPRDTQKTSDELHVPKERLAFVTASPSPMYARYKSALCPLSRSPAGRPCFSSPLASK